MHAERPPGVSEDLEHRLVCTSNERYKRTMRWMLFAIAVGLGLGCGDDDSPDVDGGVDAGTDADPSDTSPDVPFDAGDRPSANTTAGPVVGTESDGVAVYWGIPYAAPPVGELRFANPQPHPGWTEPLVADQRVTCAHNDLTDGELGVEDCLVVNVFAPVDASNAEVMVFIHGGGFSQGSSSIDLYEGSSLAQRGVVVVTMNYRLGMLGFLAHAELEGGNYGIADQLLALQWVRDNVAAFGGDPSEVTIFGESAGAVSVVVHVASAQSTGLFARAVSQSSGGGLGVATEANALTRSADMIEAAGCTSDTVNCLRAADVSTLVNATSGAGMGATGLPNVGPYIDGSLIEAVPFERIADGSANDVPMIIGANADEATIFTNSIPVPNDAAFRSILELVYADPDTVDGVLALYPSGELGNSKERFNTFFGEIAFVCPSYLLAAAGSEGESTYAYYFTRVLPGLTGRLGAFHGLELFYVFGNLDVTAYVPNADDMVLRDTMQDAWVSFAQGNAPTFAPGWPAYSAATPTLAIFDEPPSASTDDPSDGRCAGLQALGLLPDS